MKKKTIQQFDKKDCGVACLTSISAFYGKNIPLHKVRTLAGTTTEGNSMFSLLKAADALGFDADAWQVDDLHEMEGQMTFPSIAHVVRKEGFGHFVILWGMKNGVLLVGDPEDGRNRKISAEEFSQTCTGMVMSLTPNENFVKEKGENRKKEMFLNIIKDNKSALLKVTALSVFVYLIGMAGSFYYQMFIDQFIPEGTASKVYQLGAGMIFAYLIQGFVNIYRQKSMIRMSKNIDNKLMLESYKHIIKLPMEFFDTRKNGEVLNRLNDAFKIHEVVCSTAIGIVLDIFVGLIGAGIMLFINPTLFLVCSVVSVVSLIAALLLKNKMKQVNLMMMQKNAEFSSAIIEHLSGEEVIKTCSYEEGSFQTVRDKYNQVIEFANKSVAINSFQGVFTEFMSSSTGIAILMLGFTFIVNQGMSIGQLIMFNTMLSYFLTPVCSLLGVIPELQEAFAAADRLNELLEMQAEAVDGNADDVTIEDISVEHMSFEYGDNRVLNDVNLHIRKGESIAIVGESGCGKTTFVKALMGLYPVAEGKICYGTCDMKDMPLAGLRKKTAYVPQSNFLFAATIRENLAMGQNVTDDEIVAACKAVEMHDKIMKMPAGYDTMLEEGGGNLSGGERQRLAIARALLKKNADMYVLDEATSNLDSRTENAISKVLFDQLKNNTRVIIAHRLGTIRQCDRIVVMNSNGQIEEIGNHMELMAKRGMYYQLWIRQNGAEESFAAAA